MRWGRGSASGRAAAACAMHPVHSLLAAPTVMSRERKGRTVKGSKCQEAKAQDQVSTWVYQS